MGGDIDNRFSGKTSATLLVRRSAPAEPSQGWAEFVRRTILRRRAPMTEQPPPSQETPADARRGEDAAEGAGRALPPSEGERDRLDWLENRQPPTFTQRMDRTLFVVVLLVAAVACVGLIVILLRYFTR